MCGGETASCAAALVEGIEAAKQAELAKKEIDGVFAELNANIRNVSGGQVEISRREFPESPPPVALLDALTGKARYTAIIAKNPNVSQGPIMQLTRWQPDSNGYPCKVSWGRQDRYCEDKQALENCLLELLRDPTVGQKINALINLPPANPPERG